MDRDPEKLAMKRRFWSKVKIQQGCWLWIASRNQKGYGNILVGSRTDGTRKVAKAHRVAWELIRGPIPAGLWVLHRCDNPPCVRPSHLFLGTARDNTLDMCAKGRHGRKGAQAGARHHNAKLTRDDVEEIRRRYASGDISQERLGKEFGVGQAQVGRIVRLERWV